MSEPTSSSVSVPATTTATTAAGGRIGRFEILLQIGRGGMARVFLARLSGVGGFERLFALKVLHDHLREERESNAHLLEEAKLAGRLRHPNIVAVVDAGEDRAGVYLVMEYVEGDALSGLMAAARKGGSRVPEGIALRVLHDAMAGLDASHELRDENGSPLGLVHRDFSPQNILVGTDGVARLTDFGIAKIARSSASAGVVTQEGLVKGKARYMSPEQARGRRLDRRSDIWAAGVVAWELLAGEDLFPRGDDTAAICSIVSDTPRRLRSVRPEISSEVDDCIARALSPDPDQRFATLEEMRKALLAACGVPPADREEVASYVRQTARVVLAERAGALTRVMAECASSSSVGAETSTIRDPARRFLPAGRQRLLFAAVVIAGVVVLGATLAWYRDDKASSTSAVPVGSPAAGEVDVASSSAASPSASSRPAPAPALASSPSLIGSTEGATASASQAPLAPAASHRGEPRPRSRRPTTGPLRAAKPAAGGTGLMPDSL
jgi:eukaryotic-like serine/threonine-protein kinase